MPSFIIGNRSGGDIIVSGNPYSGQIRPVGGIALKYDKASSGNAYIGLSGGMTVTSGGFFASGGGLLDGMLMNPGDSYFVPRIGTGLSGNLTVYASCDAAASGRNRLYFEVF